jgi:hypothetical protein
MSLLRSSPLDSFHFHMRSQVFHHLGYLILVSLSLSLSPPLSLTSSLCLSLSLSLSVQNSSSPPLLIFFIFLHASSFLAFTFPSSILIGLSRVPFSIQFATFSLLVTFFAHIINQNKWSKEKNKKKLMLMYTASNVVFLALIVVILVLSGIFHDYECDRQGCCACGESCCPTVCKKKGTYGCGEWYNHTGPMEWCTYGSWSQEFIDPASDGSCDLDVNCPCHGTLGSAAHVTIECCQPLWLTNLGAGVAGSIFLVLDLFIAIYGYRISVMMRESAGFKVHILISLWICSEMPWRSVIRWVFFRSAAHLLFFRCLSNPKVVIRDAYSSSLCSSS